MAARDVADAKQRRFHAWAAAVRASVEVIHALTDESGEQEQALKHLLRCSNPDAVAIGTLALELRARRFGIERIIAALPPLDESEPGQAGRPDGRDRGFVRSVAALER